MFVGDSVKPNAMGGLNPVLFYIPALWTLLHAATLSWRVRVGTSRDSNITLTQLRGLQSCNHVAQLVF